MRDYESTDTTEAIAWITSFLSSPEESAPERRARHAMTILQVLLKPKNLKGTQPFDTYAPKTGDDTYNSMLISFNKMVLNMENYTGYNEDNYTQWPYNLHYLLDVYMATVLNVELPDKPLHLLLNDEGIQALISPFVPNFRETLYHMMYLRQMQDNGNDGDGEAV